MSNQSDEVAALDLWVVTWQGRRCPAYMTGDRSGHCGWGEIPRPVEVLWEGVER